MITMLVIKYRGVTEKHKKSQKTECIVRFVSSFWGITNETLNTYFSFVLDVEYKGESVDGIFYKCKVTVSMRQLGRLLYKEEFLECQKVCVA